MRQALWTAGEPLIQMCRIVYSPEEGFQRSVTGMDGSPMAEVAIDCVCERDFRAWRSDDL